MSRVSPRFIPACAGNRCILGIPLVISPVHPRVCGEQQKPQPMLTAISGSSPRVRGTDDKIPNRNPLCRFIPACAGNRLPRGGGALLPPVHPRVCGEQTILFYRSRGFSGSSPRVRGTGRAMLRRVLRTTVHPRVCGEQWKRCVSVMRCVGSSPRVRGTASRRLRCLLTKRFIPACAGNSDPLHKLDLPQAVHPRVCGEQCPDSRQIVSTLGSSPRVRGTVMIGKFVQTGQRFIPACAGNRHLWTVYTRRIAVHPRVCGEQFRSSDPKIVTTGSSPRVRGTVASWKPFVNAMRFIPACAGNSLAFSQFLS